MKDFSPADLHVLNAAVGWLELGNPREAQHELGRLAPDVQTRSEVLELWWRVFSDQKDWSAALDVAGRWVGVAPETPAGWINRSYCLHELHRTQEAWDQLLPAASRFPLEPTFAYNLACYACRLGRLALALEWLKKAARLLGPRQLKALAREDPDLAPMRKAIDRL